MSMLYGAHVSTSGGLDTAIDRGIALGVTAIQSFASSPRSLGFSPPSPTIITRYLEKKSASDIKCHVFHGIYLINLAHETQEFRERSCESLIQYQRLAGQIGGLGTIFHLGSHKGAGFAAVKDQVVSCLLKVTKGSPANVSLIIENAAGHQGVIGANLEELKSIFDAYLALGGDPHKLALGIDTQHAFASGYAIHTKKGLEDFISKIDSLFTLAKLKMVHLNGSLVPFGSFRDRHANLNEGYLDLESLSRVVNHPQLVHLPFILEVPGIAKAGPGVADVNQLRSLFKNL